VVDASLKGDQFRTLVLEDDRTSQALVTQAIIRAVPEGLVLTASTLAEARQLLATYQFQFGVLDIHLPDGSGIDFLHDMQMKSPHAAVVIFTAAPLPEYRAQAEAFGVLHFMEKPVDPPVLGRLVRNYWQKASGKGDVGTGFSASLSRLTTLDIIQLKCLGRSTVALDFVGRQGQQGRIYFKQGEIFHAETGEGQGIDAFNEIVSWRGGQVMEVTHAPATARTIQGDWQNLLMHAVQWADENRPR
jgi:DNA-binding response OmpR family regulator